MAVTTTLRQRTKLGNARMNVVDVVIDSETYATGGIAITAAKMGLGLPYVVIPAPAAGYIFEFDHGESKLKAFTPVKAQIAHSHANTLGNAAHTHANTLGNAAHTHGNSLTPTSEEYLQAYSQPNVKGSKNTDHENTDTGDTPTNHAGIAAEATVATTWTKGAITQPDIPRNVGIVIKNDGDGALELHEGVMTFTVTGTFRGEPQEDLITFESTTENKSVANGGTDNYRVKYGVKPFDTVTDITLDNMPDDGFKISACPGSKIGLPVDLATPDAGDVQKVTKNDADVDPATLVDTTEMTVNLDELSDEDTFSIIYDGIEPLTGVAISNSEETVTISNAEETVTISNADGGAVDAAAASEVGDQASLTVTLRLIAIGI